MSSAYDFDDEYDAFMAGDVGTELPMISDPFDMDELPTAPRRNRAITAPTTVRERRDSFSEPEPVVARPIILPSAASLAAEQAPEPPAPELTLGTSAWSSETSARVAEELANYNYESEDDDIYFPDIETYNEDNPPLRPMRIRHYSESAPARAESAPAAVNSDHASHVQRTRARMTAIYAKDVPKVRGFINKFVARPERAPRMRPLDTPATASPVIPLMRRETSAKSPLSVTHEFELNTGAVAIPQYLELVEAEAEVKVAEVVVVLVEAEVKVEVDEAEAAAEKEAAAAEAARIAAISAGVTARLLAKAAAERERRDARRAEREAAAAAEAEIAAEAAAEAAARAAKKEKVREKAKAKGKIVVIKPVIEPLKIIVGASSHRSMSEREILSRAYTPGILQTIVCKLFIEGYTELTRCYGEKTHRVAIPPIVTGGINMASPIQCNMIHAMPYPVSICKEGMTCEWYNRQTYELMGLPIPSRYKFSRKCYFLHVGTKNIVRDNVEFVQCGVVGCTESDSMHYTPRGDAPMRIVHITPSEEKCDKDNSTFCPNMIGNGCSRQHTMAGTAMMGALIRGVLQHYIPDPEEWGSRDYTYLNGFVKDMCHIEIPNGTGTFRDCLTKIPGMWTRDIYRRYEGSNPKTGGKPYGDTKSAMQKTTARKPQAQLATKPKGKPQLQVGKASKKQ